jgi:hypothetical protein
VPFTAWEWKEPSSIVGCDDDELLVDELLDPDPPQPATATTARTPQTTATARAAALVRALSVGSGQGTLSACREPI